MRTFKTPLVPINHDMHENVPPIFYSLYTQQNYFITVFPSKSATRLHCEQSLFCSKIRRENVICEGRSREKRGRRKTSPYARAIRVSRFCPSEITFSQRMFEQKGNCSQSATRLPSKTKLQSIRINIQYSALLRHTNKPMYTYQLQ